MQCAYAVLSSVAYPVLPYFPHYLINGAIFGGKKKLLSTKCLFGSSLQLFLILRRTELDMIRKWIYVFMYRTVIPVRF